MHGQMQNRGPMAQPMQQQLSLQQQRGGKRSSTSPGEEVCRYSSSDYSYVVSLLLTWNTSIRHYPETNSPRQTVSANAKLLRILRSSNSNSRSRNRNSRSNSNSNNSSSRSPSNSHSHNSHSKRHIRHSSSTNRNNPRWHPLVRFSRAYSICKELGMRGACLCLAVRVLPVDLVAHRCIQWEWGR